MKIDKVVYTPNFLKSSRKLPQKIKEKAFKKELIFKHNAFHPGLKTHALSGNLRGLHSFSIDYAYRIIFRFESDEAATFIDVGTHSIYK